MNLETGDFELVSSLGDLMNHEHKASMDKAVYRLYTMNPDCTLLSIDSVHEGTRRQYILDIASLAA